MSLSQQIGFIGGDHGAISANKEGWDINPSSKEGWDINLVSKETMISLKGNPTGYIKPRFI